MNKQEIEQKIASLEKELAELKSELALQDKIWQPKMREKYWYVNYTGDVGTWICFESNVDKSCIDFDNCFQTKEEAKKQAEYNRVMNRFRKYVEAYSEPLDWNNVFMDKWYLCYKYGEIKTRFSFVNTNRDAFQIYASSEQILKDAIIYSAGSEEEFVRIVFKGGK